MIYMGSKAKIAKYLLPIVKRYLTKDRWYVEPFCGGCNMIDKVRHDKRIANDYNKYLIALFKALQEGIEFPVYISKEEYDTVKQNKENFPDWYVGYVGFVCSFRGKFFNGWKCSLFDTKDGDVRNYQRESLNNLLSQSFFLRDVKFTCGSYKDLLIPENSVIYCDPPYQDTTSYKNESEFNHDEFWQWCRDMVNKGHDVLVSEYNAPDDFVAVWNKQVNSRLSGKNVISIEKLFVHESIADRYRSKELELF